MQNRESPVLTIVSGRDTRKLSVAVITKKYQLMLLILTSLFKYLIKEITKTIKILIIYINCIPILGGR